MNLEALSGDDNSFDEEPENRLAGVKVGLLELGPKDVDELLGAASAIVCHLRLKLLGLEFSQGVLGGEPAFFEGIHAGLEEPERQSADLVGIRQPIPLAGELLKARFGLLQAGIAVRGGGG